MANKKTLYTGLLLLLLALTASFFFFNSREKSHRPKSESERLEEVLQQDRQNLQSNKAKEHQIYGAMVRLAKLNKDPQSLSEALTYSKSKSTQLRKGSALALGYFSIEKADETLFKMTQDEDPSVRSQAILALSTTPSTKRTQKLEQLFSKRNKLTPAEKVNLYTSLAKIEKDQEKQKVYFKLLSYIALKGYEPNNSMAALRLSRLGTNLNITKKTFHTIIENSQFSDRLTEIAVRHLATQRDSILKSKVETLFNHKSPRVRMSIIQTLHHSCPDARWNILKKALIQDRDRQVTSAAIQEFIYLPGKSAKTVLLEIISNPDSPPESVELAKKAQEQETNSKKANPCSN